MLFIMFNPPLDFEIMVFVIGHTHKVKYLSYKNPNHFAHLPQSPRGRHPQTKGLGKSATIREVAAHTHNIVHIQFGRFGVLLWFHLFITFIHG